MKSSSTAAASATFSSEGFDLDAASGDGDVVYEIGGGASRKEEPDSNLNDSSSSSQQQPPKEDEETKKEDSVMTEADEYKQRGNQAFQAGEWSEAYDLYTLAMDATPGMTGDEILKLRDAWQEEQRKEARERLRREQEAEEAKRRKRREQQQQQKDAQTESDAASAAANKEEPEEDEETDPKKQVKKERFVPPPHVHGTKLAVYYCNRAATLLHLERYEKAISDCDVAILLNPLYTKAYMRRATAYEKMEQTEQALEDVKQALLTSPGNAQIQTQVKRLQKLEDERMEKLKEETMDKLKDLGNSLLGNFGLSLDNFQTVQDPKTGSYSISFNQNK